MIDDDLIIDIVKEKGYRLKDYSYMNAKTLYDELKKYQPALSKEHLGSIIISYARDRHPRIGFIPSSRPGQEKPTPIKFVAPDGFTHWIAGVTVR